MAIALMSLVRGVAQHSPFALQLDVERRMSSHPPPSRTTVGAAKSTWVV